jgi:hypothetical protein
MSKQTLEINAPSEHANPYNVASEAEAKDGQACIVLLLLMVCLSVFCAFDFLGR